MIRAGGESLSSISTEGKGEERRDPRKMFEAKSKKAGGCFSFTAKGRGNLILASEAAIVNDEKKEKRSVLSVGRKKKGRKKRKSVRNRQPWGREEGPPCPNENVKKKESYL